MYVRMCMYVCVCVYMYTCMYVCMYVCMYICMYVLYMYVLHMYVCMYTLKFWWLSCLTFKRENCPSPGGNFPSVNLSGGGGKCPPGGNCSALDLNTVLSVYLL